MKKILLVLSILSALSCQSLTPKTPAYSADCRGDREPANLSCRSVLRARLVPERAPTEAELKVIFDQLENYGVTQWKLIEAAEMGYKYNITEGEGKPNTLGMILLERRKLKDSTAKILTELGYREHAGYLMPPNRNFPKFYAKIYSRIFDAAAKSGVSNDDLLLPTFLFSRDEEKLFIRPGIDPLPPLGEGWKLETSEAELPGYLFSRMILEGKMLFSVGMFFHDIGHFIDYIERPEYMPAFKNYIRIKTDYLKSEPKTYVERRKVYGKIAGRDEMERYLNEWVYFPLVENSAQIESVLDINLKENRNEDEVRFINSELSRNQVVKKAERVWKLQNILFSRHGGGARDMSVEINTDLEDILESIEDFASPISLFTDRYERKPSGKARDQGYRDNEAPMMFQRLKLFTDALSNPSAVPVELTQKLAVMADTAQVKPETLVRTLLDNQLAEIEFRIRKVLEFKMTPVQLANDLSVLYQPDGWKKYRKTNTFKYYSTYKLNSFQWYHLVDVAGPSDPLN